MRPSVVVALAIALAAIAPHTLLTLLAGAAGVILECLPYLALAASIAPVAGNYAHALRAYAGCGCGIGPSARSLPAGLVTAALFGPIVAIARIVAASIASRPVRDDAPHEHFNLLGDIVDLAPAALVAAALTVFLPTLPLHALPALAAFTIGAMLGTVASPCALGGVALAAALHASAPLAAAGVLCTAGIADVFAFRRRAHRVALHDPWAYALLALACAVVAVHHGSGFVHPRMTLPLASCACYCAWLACRFRAGHARASRFLAAALAAIAVIGAPAPVYHATETTLADAFAGERIDFTGVAVADRSQSLLVRYAITCCRADAAPIAVALDRSLSRFNGHWLHARGVIEDRNGALQLHVAELTPVTPPADPFVYR